MARWGVREATERNPFGNDPMADVTVVDKSRPIVFTPDKVMERLELNTDQEWALSLDQDRGPFYGGSPLGSDEDFLRDLGEHMTVPPTKQARLTGVITNALDEDSVEANGRLVVLWFAQSPDARRWLFTDPQVFTDAREEKVRETFQTGMFIAYYARPEGGKDQTKAVEQWLEEVARCPNDAGACPVPATN